MFRAAVGTALCASVSLAAGPADPATGSGTGGAAAAPGGSRMALAPLPNQVVGTEINDAQIASVTKGLNALARNQNSNGSWGGLGGYGAQAAITALAGLALMDNGNLPGRGRYGDNVKRAVDFVARSSQESGLLTAGTSTGEMYSHGFATLFLGEVYGMTGDEDIKEKLQKAVRLIEKSQNGEGGWRYQPAPLDADISVTICQVMALRAARDAGIKVEKDTIDKAIAYVRRCQNPDGGFNYQAAGGGGSGFARTGAGTSALYYAGVFDDDSVKRGLEYLMRFVPSDRTNLADDGNGHFYYGQYYAVQAMFLAGGRYWKTWYPAIRDLLIERQNADSGVWNGEVDENYCTAVALIILQMPNRYLPVFNGKGPGG